MGLVMEAFGLPRMWGRVFGALLLADPPEQTAEELATTLKASRGSISTATRMLEQARLIERISKPGQRKDYFRNKPGAWHEITKQRVAALGILRQMSEKGLQLLDGAGPEVRRGLSEMRDYFAYWEKIFPRLVAEWQAADQAKQDGN
ncbi:MAG: MarR family transcriptional regulator [Truepera sp.]|nr:MarR family transcriptional regulator [Truepera sp.]